MPEPKPNEPQDEFLSRCIPIVLEDGSAKDQEQAAAMCADMWRRRDKEMKKSNEQLFALPNVEVFRAGKWNGDEYSVEDLDEMVSNFPRVGFDVPVKLGHSDGPGEPAYGWVESVLRLGDRVVANLRDLPEKVYEAIRDRRYDAISSEIFWNLKRNGESFRRVLKAVALLGAETPAVSGLKPLRDSLRGFSEAELASVHRHNIGKDILMPKDMDGGTNGAAELKAVAKSLGLKENATQADIDAKLAELTEQAGKVKELQAQLEAAKAGEGGAEIKQLTDKLADLTSRLKESEEAAKKATIERKVEEIKLPWARSYARSLYEAVLGEGVAKTVSFSFSDTMGKPVTKQEEPAKILDSLFGEVNKHVAKLFNELGRHEGSDRTKSEDDPGKEIDRLAKAKAKAEKLSYSEAMKAVLSDPENAALKEAYARQR